MGFFKKLKEQFTPIEVEEPASHEEKPTELEKDETEKDNSIQESEVQETSDEQSEAPVAPQEDEEKEEEEKHESPVEEDQPELEAPETSVPQEELEAPKVEEQEETPLPEPEDTEALPEEPAVVESKEKQASIAEKFRKGLAKTRDSFSTKINELVAKYREVDEEFFEELEEVLISADVGVHAVMDLIEELEMEVKRRNIKDTREVREVISEKLVELYYGDEEEEEVQGLRTEPDGLSVYLFVGVNGVGKTTSIGKLAYQLRQEGKKVILAAGDTFRAGAIEQLHSWGDRVGVDVIKHSAGSDPAAVVYDGIKAAKSRKADVLICDTAGRLQNKVNLMNELSKVKKVISREIPGAPHEVLLTLDATTGQNAMSQAKTFSEVTDVTGIVLTKLDGTAKGGIILAIRKELEIPVKLVGLGEGVNDLEAFDAHAFVYGLFADMIDEYEEQGEEE
ncbi:signal recognition particle-docking protein FtsY [Salimicrobium flavidum]|uniref:Signal recognition particle receptor FtsY n=1 Tax=Salimicrobium flavidum TaxID=570947 RepID=A0A1N7IKW9_9BACI|nr:signal recognition particle-docking protein FtsY [Salimicrobium flavidum]SIS37739.1 signal recognition particle-docking protein FtsY [Salimicrobium flavidum]